MSIVLVKLTRPDGDPVWVSVDAIVSIGSNTQGPGTTITLTTGFQVVQEQATEVLHKIEQRLHGLSG